MGNEKQYDRAVVAAWFNSLHHAANSAFLKGIGIMMMSWTATMDAKKMLLRWNLVNAAAAFWTWIPTMLECPIAVIVAP